MALAREDEGVDQDAIAFLIDEHAAVDRLFARYESLRPGGDAASRREVVGRIIRELRLHAAMEEVSFYPSIAEVLADGPALVETSLREHAQASLELDALENMGADDPGFHASVESLIQDVRHHVHEEEHELLPRLHQAVGEGWLRELGRALRRTKARLAAERAGAGATTIAEPAPPVLTREGPPTVRRRREAATRGRGASTARRSGPARTRKASSAPRSSRRTTRVTYHVVPGEDGRWRVAKRGAARSSGVFDRKADAVARGKELARKPSRGQLIVHKADGTIQQEFTYGGDPRRTRG